MSKSAPVIDYYTLEYPPPLASLELPLPATIRIERLSISPIYQKQKLIYKKENYKRNPYVYHQWLSYPGEMIAHFIARDFARSQRFKGVFYPKMVARSRYRLKGNVEEILEIDSPSGWKARLSLHLILIDDAGKSLPEKILFQKFYSKTVDCERKNPRAFVKALSQCLKKIVETLIDDTEMAIRSGKQ